MPWIGPAITVGVGLLGASSSGGGQQTVSKDPWGPAQDWMKSNITAGQNLQAQYAANPFSDYQKQAYGNQRQLSSNAQKLLGDLIPQMNNFQGFNRSNPTQKPTPFQFNMPQQAPVNFGMSAPSVDATPAPAPVVQAPQMSFAQQMERYQMEQNRKARQNGGGRMGA